ncbi:SMODS-associated NUDIX domain-containing protein [Leptotrichia hongkongensis]|uniref:SMODS-associated NUDIX domain-containing protein n=1 Tax=Leptotrichia hongkongensis TaxID=554406 RepID=UPI0035A85884
MKIWFQFLFRWNKNIRLSCAYLFQIKQDGKYLLIKGNQIEQYQPVSGVYKYYNS